MIIKTKRKSLWYMKGDISNRNLINNFLKKPQIRVLMLLRNLIYELFDLKGIGSLSIQIYRESWIKNVKLILNIFFNKKYFFIYIF